MNAVSGVHELLHAIGYYGAYALIISAVAALAGGALLAIGATLSDRR